MLMIHNFIFPFSHLELVLGIKLCLPLSVVYMRLITGHGGWSTVLHRSKDKIELLKYSPLNIYLDQSFKKSVVNESIRSS